MTIYRLKPKNDFVFGRLFGEQRSKESLIALLNAILRQDGAEPIVDLKVIENRHLKKLIFDEKTGSLDIRAELAGGEQVNVEMQVANPYNMVKRTLFYMSKLFVESIKSGEKYDRLKKTIVINLLDFELLEIESFHSTFHLREDHVPRFMLTDVLEVHFIEFPKELMAMDPIIGKTEEELELLSSDEFMRELAEARERARRDWESSMDGSKAEGKAEGKVEIALKLLRRGMEPEIVSEVTGLPLLDIERIDSEHRKQ